MRSIYLKRMQTYSHFLFNLHLFCLAFVVLSDFLLLGVNYLHFLNVEFL